MTATNRIYFAALAGALIAVAAILVIGLAPSGVFFTPTVGGSAERAQAQAEDDYLAGLEDASPELWELPYADGVDPDTALVGLGRTACDAAAGGTSWPQVAGLMSERGFSTRDAMAVAANAERNLCPAG